MRPALYSFGDQPSWKDKLWIIGDHGPRRIWWDLPLFNFFSPLITGGYPLLDRQPDGRESGMMCGALEGGMTLAVETCHSRAVGVNMELNESSTATSGQDAALCGHQTASTNSILLFSPSRCLCRGLVASLYWQIFNVDCMWLIRF